MPPQPPIISDPNEKLLPPARHSSAGPIIGTLIIVVVMIFGALYFWGAYLNQKNTPPTQLPFIPADTSSQTQ